MAAKRQSGLIWAQGQPKKKPRDDFDNLHKLVSENPDAFDGPWLTWLKNKLEIESPEFIEFNELDRDTMVAVWYQDAIPSATGQFSGIWRVPYVNGESVTFDVYRASVHVSTAPSSAPTFSFEVSAGTGAPSWSVIGTVSVTASTYSGNKTATWTTSSVTSGQVLRVNVTTVGSGYATITCQLEARVS